MTSRRPLWPAERRKVEAYPQRYWFRVPGPTVEGNTASGWWVGFDGSRGIDSTVWPTTPADFGQQWLHPPLGLDGDRPDLWPDLLIVLAVTAAAVLGFVLGLAARS